jgi:hypothetical protein
MVFLRLFAAQPNLRIASLALPRFVFEVVEIDLILIMVLRMGEDRVGENVLLGVFGQA